MNSNEVRLDFFFVWYYRCGQAIFMTYCINRVWPTRSNGCCQDYWYVWAMKKWNLDHQKSNLNFEAKSSMFLCQLFLAKSCVCNCIFFCNKHDGWWGIGYFMNGMNNVDEQLVQVQAIGLLYECGLDARPRLLPVLCLTRTCLIWAC